MVAYEHRSIIKDTAVPLKTYFIPGSTDININACILLLIETSHALKGFLELYFKAVGFYHNHFFVYDNSTIFDKVFHKFKEVPRIILQYRK